LGDVREAAEIFSKHNDLLIGGFKKDSMLAVEYPGKGT
jgi:hypothetical protein